MNRSLAWRWVAIVACVSGGWLGARAAEGQVQPPVTPAQVTAMQSQLTEMQRQIATLNARAAALESWKASAGVFTAGSDGTWAFAPPQGSVRIASQGSVQVQANDAFDLAAKNTARFVTTASPPAGTITIETGLLVMKSRKRDFP